MNNMNIVSSVKVDKEYVSGLIEKVALIRLDLKKHFENDLPTTFPKGMSMNITEVDNDLCEAFSGLLGLYGYLIEMEVNS